MHLQAGASRPPLHRNNMAALDDPRTFGRTRLSFAKSTDIDEFASMLD